MSDDSQQPPVLRLKPRLRADVEPSASPESAGAEPSTPRDEAVFASAATEPARIRLKPRIGIAEAGSAAHEVPPPAADAPAEPGAPPALPVPANGSEASVAEASPAPLRPKLRLAAEPATSASAVRAEPPALFLPPETATPPPEPAVAAAVEPPPPPAPAPSVDPSTFPPPPKRVPTEATGNKAVPPRGEPRPPEHKPAFKVALAVVTFAAVAVLAASVFFGYGLLSGSEETPAAVESPTAGAPTPTASAPTDAGTAAATASPPAAPKSAAGRLIQQARAAASARVDEIPLPDEPVASAPSPAVSVAQPKVIAPARSLPTEPRVAPGAAFQQWVSEARVSGVRGGTDARAFINGRLVRQGQVVDSSLGISFEGVDDRQNLLLFRDGAGSVVGKRF